MDKNINIQLPEDIHKSLKLMAVKQDKTLKELVIQILSK